MKNATATPVARDAHRATPASTRARALALHPSNGTRARAMAAHPSSSTRAVHA